MALDTTDNTIITDKDMLIAYMAKGEKPKSHWRIGTEHEKFPFYIDGHRPVPYGGTNGIKAILDGMQEKLGWNPVYDNGNIIGLVEPTGNGAISLEPGGQFELSGAPVETVYQSCREVNAHLAQLREIATPLGIGFLGVGASPKWTLSETPIMPKTRYDIMRHYMPKVGTQGLDMMYRTSTIQVNLDFSDESDMRCKMQVATKLQSIATALFATSPFTEGKPNGYLSWRSDIWRDTDNNRSGILPFIFSPEFGYADYVEWALDVPMYFVLRDGHYIDATDITFRQFMQGGLRAKLGQGENGEPNIGDWINHLSTLFPEVRLKQFLEMRGADGGPWRRICALPAFWVGLLYDSRALESAASLTRDWRYEDVLEMRNNVPKLGLNTPFQGTTIREIARQCIDISRQGLVARNITNKDGFDESRFLDPLEDVVISGKTEAEKLLSQYHSVWDGSIDPIFYEYAY